MGLELLQSQNQPNLAPCNHEEADTKIFVHVKDVCSNGHSSVGIRTGDSDVMVLAITNYPKIPNLQELWVQWGTANKKRNYPIHQLHQEVAHNIAAGLPLFHA